MPPQSIQNWQLFTKNRVHEKEETEISNDEKRKNMIVADDTEEIRIDLQCKRNEGEATGNVYFVRLKELIAKC